MIDPAVANNSSPSSDLVGFLLLDKPAGITSNVALQRAKRLSGARKAGHTGSLDPLATGMLPLCFGAATKLSAYVLKADKGYDVEARLGVRTTTEDADGDVIEEAPIGDISRSDVIATLEQLLGEQMQVPPMYSAIRHEGRRLYDLARRGIIVERAPRKVNITELSLIGFDLPHVRLRVRCSTGTYVRTLVTEIAAKLGTLGHVTALRRFGVEPFWDARMVTLEELESSAREGRDAIERLLWPVDSVLEDWPALWLETDDAERIRNGQKLLWPDANAPGWYRLYSAERDFVGIGEKLADDRLVPRRIFL